MKLTHFFQFSCQKKQLHSEISSDIFMAAYCVQLTPSLPFKVWPCNQLVLARQINVETKKNTLRCKTNPGAGFHFQCAQNAVATSRTCAEHGHHLLKAPESAVTATTQNSRPCRSFCPSSHVPRDVRTDTRACVYIHGWVYTHARAVNGTAGRRHPYSRRMRPRHTTWRMAPAAAAAAPSSSSSTAPLAGSWYRMHRCLFTGS